MPRSSPPFDLAAFRSSGSAFLDSLVTELKAAGIPADEMTADHLCYRVGSQAEYEHFRHELASRARLLTEALVNGRPICTFRLAEGFRAGDRLVELVELPAPKPGAAYATGFEHAEFVITETFEDFAARYPGLAFVRSRSSALNPELCLRLGGRQAKFHHQPLDRVIEIEETELTDIVFDLDGTLIESREHIYEINRIVFSEALDREVTREESIAKFHPEFAKLFEHFEVTCSERRGRAVARWGEVAEGFDYKLFDGVVDLLDGLRDRGPSLHLWTARDERSARKILRHHGIEERFATLSFATEKDSKPHANSLRFDWRSARAIVIGDSPSDAAGAKNIGAVRAAALWDPHARESALISAGAELFFRHPIDLHDWLTRW